MALQVFAFSPKGRNAVEPEIRNDYFIEHEGKFIAQMDENYRVVLIGHRICASDHPDSYHVKSNVHLSSIRYQRKDFVGDFASNKSMKEADKILRLELASALFKVV